MFTLYCADGPIHSLPAQAARHSELLSTLMLVDKDGTKQISLPFVSAHVLPVLNWLEHHQNDEVFKPPTQRGFQPATLELSSWEDTFLRTLNKTPKYLFAVLHVAEYLGAEHLMQCGGYFIALHLKGKSAKECSEYMTVEDDRTEEDELETASPPPTDKKSPVNHGNRRRRR